MGSYGESRVRKKVIVVMAQTTTIRARKRLTVKASRLCIPYSLSCAAQRRRRPTARYGNAGVPAGQPALPVLVRSMREPWSQPSSGGCDATEGGLACLIHQIERREYILSGAVPPHPPCSAS